MGKDVMKELEKEYDSDEVLDKEINQLEKVEPVTKSLSDMATIYKKIMNKLITLDSVCYICKKEIKEKEPVDIVQVPNDKTDKGLVAFVSICRRCNS